EEDKLPVTMGMTAAAFTNVTGAKATAEVKMVSNLIGGQSTGNISAQAMNQSGANVNFLASATAKNGVANPVMVSSQTVGNAAQMNYQTVTLEDPNRSVGTLRNQ